MQGAIDNGLEWSSLMDNYSSPLQYALVGFNSLRPCDDHIGGQQTEILAHDTSRHTEEVAIESGSIWFEYAQYEC
jgi:hypothetical protein